MRRRTVKPYQARRRGPLLVLAAMIAAGYLTYAVNISIRPAMMSVMTYDCRAVATQAIQQTVLEAMELEPELFEELYTTVKTDAGEIRAIYPDTNAINRLKLRLGNEVERRLEQQKSKTFQIPLGTLLGFKLLAELGPCFEMRILQESYVTADISTEMHSTGVNQTEFIMNADFEVLMSATIGGYAAPIITRYHLPVVQFVIVGPIPQYYSAA